MSKRAFYVANLVVGLALVVSASTSARGEDYYKDKTLRILVPYSPGGGSDIMSRLLARLIGKHIPGNPNVIVQNMPGGGGVIALNYLYNISKPDGLTIGHTSIPGLRDQLAGTQGVKHDYGRFEYLGSAGPNQQLFTVRTGLPYKTLKDLKKAEKPIFVAAASAASTPAVVGRILEREGVKIKLTPGYRGAAIRIQAMLKGEMDATTLIKSQVQRDRKYLRPIFWVASKGEEFGGLPSMEELPLSAKTKSFLKVVTTPLALARTFMAPPNTAEEPLRILQKAFEKTVKSSQFSSQAKKLNLPVEWMAPDRTKAIHIEVLQTPPEGVARLKEILGISK